MNEIEHITLRIELDVWQPQMMVARAEIDTLLMMLKEKRLLAHCGNVKTTMNEGA